MKLRNYQRESIDAIYAYWCNGGGNPLISLPTGSGKSYVIATLINELIASYNSIRIACVTHTKELIAQNFAELLRHWPQAPAGIYSAGIGRRDTRSQILFCGIQSVHNKINQIGGFDVLIVDEAHLIPRSADTMYGRFISNLRDEISDMRVVGMTATPYRLDSGRLDKGDDKTFDDIAYEANVADLIEQGYLSHLVSKGTDTKLSVAGVGRRGGDFIPGQLEAAVNQDSIVHAAVEEIVRYGQERRAWIAFCAGVNHAHAVRNAIRAHGVACETIIGETPSGERDRIIKSFRDGNIRCLTSVGVLTTGFNVPHVDLIALLRPTQSAGLYVQSVGRGFRLAPDKHDCLVLDFAGNVKRHGPVDAVTVRDKSSNGDGDKVELAKECPECKTLVALATRICPSCGHEWPARDEPKHDAIADASVPILSSGAPSWIPVNDVHYYKHEKFGAPPSLRVEYDCGFVAHREWVCLEHNGYAHQKAESWWLRAAETPIPRTIDEALHRQGELRWPNEIQVRPDGRFFKIVGLRYAKRNAAE